MFTGLIQALGHVGAARAAGAGLRLEVDVDGLAVSPVAGASICVSGTCLTVVERRGRFAAFDVAAETVRRSTLANIRAGAVVNLEPALRVGDPLDGHLVLGHVDGTAPLLARRDANGSQIARFGMPDNVAGWIAEKGSVAIDGISLTVSALGADWFEVSLIPETLARTTLAELSTGGLVNLEVDPLARYAVRWLTWSSDHPATAAAGGLTEAMLLENGF